LGQQDTQRRVAEATNVANQLRSQAENNYLNVLAQLNQLEQNLTMQTQAPQIQWLSEVAGSLTNAQIAAQQARQAAARSPSTALNESQRAQNATGAQLIYMVSLNDGTLQWSDGWRYRRALQWEQYYIVDAEWMPVVAL
jgi:hypothetical protein